MLNFYQIVRDNLNFNRFQFKDTVCLEYTCPIDAEEVAIYSKSDYVVHVLSGKKTYRTLTGEWTVTAGQTLYLKKGAELIHQYFDDEYCMLGFFVSDDLIQETYKEVMTKVPLDKSTTGLEYCGREIKTTPFLEGYFQSMLNFFRGIDRPPDHIMVHKLKELLITLMNADPKLTSYFHSLSSTDKPSLNEIMEKNYCYNLKLEDYAELTHRSLSSFKREFKDVYNESPAKWITKRKVQHAANLLINSDFNVTQVALDAGFEDLSHFSRVFKAEFGVNPTGYRKSLETA